MKKCQLTHVADPLPPLADTQLTLSANPVHALSKYIRTFSFLRGALNVTTTQSSEIKRLNIVVSDVTAGSANVLSIKASPRTLHCPKIFVYSK